MSRVRTLVTTLIVVANSGATPCTAQVTYDGCADYYGRPVASVLNGSLQDVAAASLAPGGAPIIQYNPYVLARFSDVTRLFWYAHECGHHALGHAFGGYPETREQEADCWGIRTLIEDGYLDEDDIQVIQREISYSPGDWTHLPGPVRAMNLPRCLGRGGTSGRGDDSCEYAHDDECDEPDLCRRGTDGSDCGRRSERPREESRGWATYCHTPNGSCVLMNRVSIGSACFCASPYGPRAGVAGD